MYLNLVYVNLSGIYNFPFCPKLSLFYSLQIKIKLFCAFFQLSLSGNHIVDMKGVSAAQGLRVLDLSNNSIVCIEGMLYNNMSTNHIPMFQVFNP